MKEDFEQKISDITNSPSTANEKISALNELLIGFNPLNNNEEMRIASELGEKISQKAGRPEMAAQFCLLRAKVEISEATLLIKEMKEIRLVPDWFEFALESEKKRYKEIDVKLQSIWKNTQSMIDLGYKLLNQKPYVGVVAYCHRTVGEIYGLNYLQLKTFYFIPGKPWKAKFGNFKLFRWIGIDDLFVTDKKSIKHLKMIKKNCLSAFHQAVKLFKKEKDPVFWVDSYLGLVLEHHSFNDAVRSKFYLWLSWWLMKWYKIKEPRLWDNYKSLKEFPLIGSNRDTKE